MNASDARKLTAENNDASVDAQRVESLLLVVYAKVHAAAKSGKDSVDIYAALTKLRGPAPTPRQWTMIYDALKEKGYRLDNARLPDATIYW